MSNTSSSSADGTTEEHGQDQTGRQPIEKNNERSWTPEDVDAAVRDFLERHHANPRMSDWGFFWWDLKATVWHWFGYHTMLPGERWSKGEDRRPHIDKVVDVCWKCEYTE